MPVSLVDRGTINAKGGAFRNSMHRYERAWKTDDECRIGCRRTTDDRCRCAPGTGKRVAFDGTALGNRSLSARGLERDFRTGVKASAALEVLQDHRVPAWSPMPVLARLGQGRSVPDVGPADQKEAVVDGELLLGADDAEL